MKMMLLINIVYSPKYTL